MIVTCPACKTRFRAEDEDLGGEGRRVRCGQCAEVWFQRPEGFEESAGDDDFASVTPDDHDAIDDFAAIAEAFGGLSSGDDDVPADDSDGAGGAEDDEFSEILGNIPDSLMPDESEFEAEDMPQSGSGGFDADEEVEQSKIFGFGAAAGIFVVSFLFFLMLHGAVTQAFPGARGFYGLFGLGAEVPGADLVFDRMKVTEKAGAVKVEGNILNLGKQVREIPIIEVSLAGRKDDDLARWYIRTPKEEIDGDGVLSFESVYDLSEDRGMAKKAHSVHLRFVLSTGGADASDEGAHDEDDVVHEDSKTDEEGGDNTHAPPADAQDHQSAHGGH
ncbi:MAG: zinc-ribbon domain-containing protein [Alphaproteobacteria bacterium]|nr:zinc-ribbon domain-containing protein [Alphaproteobacteria bacterium]